MDKTMRDDDTNDDLGVYRQETYQNLTFSKQQHQTTHTKGGKKEEGEVRYGKALEKLSQQEKDLLQHILKGQSIRHAAKLMGIKQQTAQTYWVRIKEKMA